MKLSTAGRARPTISLVAMIDVLMIMLIFFMVTSTYLNLDMIPMAERAEGEATTPIEAGSATKVLIRLGSDGVPYVGGRPLDVASFFDLARGHLKENTLTEFLILPSGHAGMQSLVTVMDTIVRAGGSRVRVVRLEARP